MTKKTLFIIRKIIAYVIAVLLIVLIVLLVKCCAFDLVYSKPSFTSVIIVSGIIAFLQLADTVLHKLSKKK